MKFYYLEKIQVTACAKQLVIKSNSAKKDDNEERTINDMLNQGGLTSKLCLQICRRDGSEERIFPWFNKLFEPYGKLFFSV